MFAEEPPTSEGKTSVNLRVEYPERLSRWLLFLKWLLVIPTYVVVGLYGIAVDITTFISFWVILFTGRYPSGLFEFAKGFMALQARTYAYFPLLLTDRYPLAAREWGENVRYEVEQPERLSRWLLLVKLPSFLLGVITTLTTVVAWLLIVLAAVPAWFAVLALGRYPRGMFNVVLAVAEWAARVMAWQYLMRDEWSLFATTRRVRYAVGAGAVAAVMWAIFLALGPRVLLQNFQMEGSSMGPALRSGQFLLINKVAYVFRSPRRGDVVVFRFPGDTNRDFIKRIIGEPGDTVEVKQGSVFIDGLPVDEPYLTHKPNYVLEPLTVPPGQYFVLGDNRPGSFDSHSWISRPPTPEWPNPPFVPEENIIGKAWLIYWPREDWGLAPNKSLAPSAP